MKNIIFFALVLALVSCSQEPKDYATLSGKIANKNSDSLVIRNRTYSKTIKVNEDGTFKDTLKVEPDVYQLFDGVEYTLVFLKNDIDLQLTVDTKDFDESIAYSGKGFETSDYLAKRRLIQENAFSPDLFNLDETSFKNKITKIQQDFSELLESYTNLDSTIHASEKENFGKMYDGLMQAYNQQKQMANQFSSFVGKPSPEFNNYENYKGGTTSLKDLKGKYVYIDVWATWCGPCKVEIPALKNIEQEYHDKNIEFVSISVDNGRGYQNNSLEASKAGWKKMIADKDMGGVQLFADKAWQSDFIKDYQINSIPRFILIDPEGKTVDANAPRPSDPKLKELFNSLSI